MKNEYFGKYRAKVVDIRDPEQRGRIRVMCPKVLGNAKSAWCEPCIPIAYDLGGDFALPKVGEFVWVEFEAGNPNKPIYTGGLWSTAKSPSATYNEKERLITWGKCKLEMNEDTDTLRISVGSNVIIINQNSIRMISPTVAVNGKPVAVEDSN